MPRLKGQPDINRQKAEFNRTLRVCMARNDIRNVQELAPMLDMPDRQVYRRMCWETKWTLPELWQLIRVLKPTREELTALFAVESGGDG